MAAAKIAVSDDDIAGARRFNRFYTRQLGLLRRGFLDSPYSLGESRVLYELARGRGITASEVARALDLDAGYLSRLLRNFEKRGLIARTAAAHDGRQSHLKLTAKGRASFAPLEKRSQQDTAAMLGRLSAPDQARLIAAMRTIEILLTPEAPSGPPYVLREPRPGDLGWIVKRHAELYAQEYGWRGEFEGLCARIVADFAANFDAGRERCWIAERNGDNAGCVMLVKDSDTVARLRLLLVDPGARGLGLGARLVDECVAFARASGYRSITLWTHSVLTAARAIYQKAGFTLTSSEKRTSFTKDVVAEFWDLRL
jgi:DNA-binding MarR family transcriptional regulator/N-acetylglutamate synthase-like GNAT family acetyltransferase